MTSVPSFLQRRPRSVPAERKPHDWDVFASRLPDSGFRTQLNSLLKNPDPTSFQEELLQFGLGLRAQGDGELAAEIFSYLLDEKSAPGVRSEAERQRNALSGTGAAGERAEFLLTRFVSDTMAAKTVVPMLAAGLAGSAVRAFSWGRLASTPGTFLSRGLAARALAGGAGFAAEGLAFASLGRAFAANPSRNFSADLASSFLSLGVFKLVGKAPAVLRFPAQVGGLLASQKLEAAFGLRPDAARDVAFLDALTAAVGMSIGSHLGRGLTGPRYAALLGEMEMRSRGAPLPRAPFLPLSAGEKVTAFAGSGRSLSQSETFSPPVLMAVGKGGGKGAGKSPPQSKAELSYAQKKAYELVIIEVGKAGEPLAKLAAKMVKDIESYNQYRPQFLRKLKPYYKEGYFDSLGDIEIHMGLDRLAGLDAPNSQFKAVDLHMKGGISYLKLAKAMTIAGVSFRKGDEVRFDEAGQLIQAPVKASRKKRGSGASGPALALIAAGSSLATLLGADNAFAALPDSLSTLSNGAMPWLPAVIGLGLGALGMAVFRKTVKDKLSPEVLAALKKDPRRATLQDVNGLIEDLYRYRRDPVRLSELLWQLKQITTSLPDFFPEARQKAQQHYQSYVAKAGSVDLVALEAAFGAAVEQNLPLDHLIAALTDIRKSNDDADIRIQVQRIFETGWKAAAVHSEKFAETGKSWDLPTWEIFLRSAVETRDSSLLTLSVFSLMEASEARNDPSMTLALLTHPHAYVRFLALMASQENDIIGTGKAAFEFKTQWESEKIFLKRDVASRDSLRLEGAYKVVGLFEKAGIEEASFIKLQLVEELERAGRGEESPADQMTPQRLAKLKRDPRRATLEDLKGLIWDFTRHLRDPERLSVLLWHLTQIGNSLPDVYPEAQAKAREFLEEYFHGARLADVQVLIAAYREAEKNKLPVKHIFEALCEIEDKNLQAEVSEAAKRFTDEIVKTETDEMFPFFERAKDLNDEGRSKLLAEAVESRDDRRINEAVLYYFLGEMVGHSPDIILPLAEHPNAMVRAAFYALRFADKENERLAERFQQELPNFWKEEKKLLKGDVASRDAYRLRAAAKIASIYSEHGVQEAALMVQEIQHILEKIN